MPTPSVPAHWSKDFAEHLRTVHFALVAISAGLILLVVSSRQYDPSKALNQIQSILDLKDRWTFESFTENTDFAAPSMKASGRHSGWIAPIDWVPTREKNERFTCGHLTGTKGPWHRSPIVLDCHFYNYWNQSYGDGAIYQITCCGPISLTQISVIILPIRRAWIRWGAVASRSPGTIQDTGWVTKPCSNRCLLILSIC